VDKEHRYVPLIEAKMVHLWNHRFGDFALLAPGQNEHILPQVPDDRLARPDYVTQPRYWVSEAEVESRLAGVWPRRWLLGWRDVTDARSSVRTVVPSLIPRVGVGDKFLLIMPAVDPRLVASLYGCLCSFPLDYCARQKVGGTSLKYFTMRQLPVLSPDHFMRPTEWQPGILLRDWIADRVLRLSYTAWDLQAFAADVGYDGPPFPWNPEWRFELRCQLDAGFFHLYGLSRADVSYVMDTFPIVRKNDEKAHGEYRTKRGILEIYDAMAEAIRTGKPYQTRLDPPAADPSVAHEPRPGMTRPGTDDYASIGDGDWGRPRNDEESEAAISIAAVLKAIGKPRPSREVRLAAMLVLEPDLLLPSLDSAQAATWRRLIGDELRALPSNVSRLVPPADRAWGGAVRHLRGTGLLAADLAAKTWAPGPGLGSMQTEGWPDGRARFVLAVLSQRGERAVFDSMPESLRGWLNATAA
jgi:hypothetical protein